MKNQVVKLDKPTQTLLNEGNQQATLQTDLAWLAGFWDGEGTITIFEVHESNKKTKLTPSISVVNTNETQMARVIEILDNIGVNMHYHLRKNANKKAKDCYILQTRNMAQIERLLTLIHPYLAGKQHLATLVLHYVRSRMGLPKRTHNGYTADEVELMLEVRRLNSRGASETTRDTPTGEDIVQSTKET